MFFHCVIGAWRAVLEQAYCGGVSVLGGGDIVWGRVENFSLKGNGKVEQPTNLSELPSTKLGIREPIEALRREIGKIASHVYAQKNEDSKVQQVEDPHFRGEAIANVMLAYRHLEDARMRLGKVLQAADFGVSILDRAPFASEEVAPTGQS